MAGSLCGASQSVQGWLQGSVVPAVHARPCRHICDGCSDTCLRVGRTFCGCCLVVWVCHGRSCSPCPVSLLLVCNCINVVWLSWLWAVCRFCFGVLQASSRWAGGVPRRAMWPVAAWSACALPVIYCICFIPVACEDRIGSSCGSSTTLVE
jgi:hypothetical protein